MDEEIRHVSDTALWVAAFRAREGQRPDAAFDDPLALMLSGERGRAIARAIPRAALVEWGMIIRTSAIDRLIDEALIAGVAVLMQSVALGLNKTFSWPGNCIGESAGPIESAQRLPA